MYTQWLQKIIIEISSQVLEVQLVAIGMEAMAAALLKGEWQVLIISCKPLSN